MIKILINVKYPSCYACAIKMCSISVIYYVIQITVRNFVVVPQHKCLPIKY